jgi:hypothetical protein
MRRSRNGDGGTLGYRRGFLFPLLNCFEHIARFRYARPVDLLLRLAIHLRRAATVLAAATMKVLTHPLCFVCFQRAGVCLLFGHANVRQGIKDRPALHF